MKRLSILLLFCLCASCAHSDWTKTDTKLALLSVTASALDAYTTKTGDFDHYINPLMDERTVIPVTVGIEAVVIGVSYFLPKRVRRALLISNTMARIGFSSHNLIQK